MGDVGKGGKGGGGGVNFVLNKRPLLALSPIRLIMFLRCGTVIV